MIDLMLDISAQLRTLQLFYHQAHNLAKGSSFVGDHELLGDFYKQAEEGYDDVAERIVGLFGPEQLSLGRILKRVENNLAVLPRMELLQSNEDFFQLALVMERELCGMCDADIEQGTTEGTKQLLGDICNMSEKRQYKIQQRLR